MRFLAGFKRYILLVGLLLVVIAVVLFLAGPEPIHCSRAFYYWKSTFKLSPVERFRLKQSGIDKLYIKYCDVDWREGRACPLASLVFADSVLPVAEIVPVIYITNKTFVSIRENAIDELANRVFQFVRQKNLLHKISCKELQIDCDWSDRTRVKYFKFLKQVGQHCKQSHVRLTTTIRLHQVKYWQRTGIPPVDRGVLMFYNMGRLGAHDFRNSIYNADDAQRYLAWLKQYPLPLDAALPVYSWTVHSRHGHVVGLIHAFTADDILVRKIAVLQKNATFIVAKPSFVRGHYLQRGDVLECETMTPELSLQAAQMLADALPQKERSIILFHLDSTILHYYEDKDIERLFRCFE